jgi:hypothetical protein
MPKTFDPEKYSKGLAKDLEAAEKTVAALIVKRDGVPAAGDDKGKAGLKAKAEKAAADLAELESQIRAAEGNVASVKRFQALANPVETESEDDEVHVYEDALPDNLPVGS